MSSTSDEIAAVMAIPRLFFCVNMIGETMPREGAIIFSELTGKLDVLYVYCRASSASMSQGPADEKILTLGFLLLRAKLR